MFKNIYENEQSVRESESLNIVDWKLVSSEIVLSEPFIREFQNKLDWGNISCNQVLSEPFIREFQDKVDWYTISCYQVLSEPFIREFQDKLDWYTISCSQVLSEPFIQEFKHKVQWSCISNYQILSKQFIQENNLTVLEYNWLYFSNEKKKKLAREYGYTVTRDDKLIAYKSTKKNGDSVFSFRYNYTVGNTYSSHCDCNSCFDNSFGLSAWSMERAKKYYPNGKLFRVSVTLEKLGCITNDGKIRCFELTIEEEIHK